MSGLDFPGERSLVVGVGKIRWYKKWQIIPCIPSQMETQFHVHFTLWSSLPFTKKSWKFWLGCNGTRRSFGSVPLENSLDERKF